MPARPGAGRKRGIRGNRIRAAYEAAIKGGTMPLEYMLKVMRDPKADLNRRDGMAAAAAPYLHSKLQSIEHHGNLFDLSKLSDEALEHLARFVEVAAAGEPRSDTDGTAPPSGTTH